MNKNELVQQLADRTGLAKNDAQKAVDGVFDCIQDALKSGTFDLVLLGPTLTRDDRHHLPYMVKKASKQTTVLVMHTDGSRHPYVDGNIDTGEDMAHLLTKIAAVTGKAAAAAAGAR